MDDRTAIGWLHRRVGFGLAPGELDQLAALGVDATLDRLLDPGAAGVAAEGSPFDGMAFDPQRRGAAIIEAVGRWLDRMTTTQRPLVEWMAWYWHGHLTTSVASVPFAPLVGDQIDLYRAAGLGDLPSLLRSATVDAAMLLYLDGNTSTGDSPNENYGRELLELFALGVGAFDEADVRAAARALTGWTVARRTGEVRFVAARHDATPQRLLGRDVDDVDSVIAAVVEHPACAPFVAGRLARAILGEVDDGLVASFGRRFADADLQIAPLVRAIVEAGLDGAGTTMFGAPVPWAAGAARATGGRPDRRAVLGLLDGAGQVPLRPPSVAGWPGGGAWLAASTVVGRFNLAFATAFAAPVDGAARTAAARGDVAALADVLGRPEGLSGPTADAVRAAPAGAGRFAGLERLAVALASPDLAVI